jgi:hypothetical protein
MNRRYFVALLAVLSIIWPMGAITSNADSEYDLPKSGTGGKGGCIAQCNMFREMDDDPEAYKECVRDCKNTNGGPPPMI